MVIRRGFWRRRSELAKGGRGPSGERRNFRSDFPTELGRRAGSLGGGRPSGASRPFANGLGRRPGASGQPLHRQLLDDRGPRGGTGRRGLCEHLPPLLHAARAVRRGCRLRREHLRGRQLQRSSRGAAGRRWYSRDVGLHGGRPGRAHGRGGRQQGRCVHVVHVQFWRSVRAPRGQPSRRAPHDRPRRGTV